MSRLRRLLFAGALALLPRAALGDDWPQYRRDAGRTGASEDPVRLPLVELWSQPRLTVLNNYDTRGHKELAVRKGSLFYILMETRGRRLVCADLRTGAIRWQQWLTPFSSGIDPSTGSTRSWVAVSENGLVFCYDVRAAYPGMRNTPLQATAFQVLAFNADNGALMDAYAPVSDYVISPAVELDPVVRVFFGDGGTRSPTDALALGPPSFQQVAEVQPPIGAQPLDPRSLVQMAVETTVAGGSFGRTGLGPPLVWGDQMAGTGLEDLFFSWAPGRSVQHVRLIHMRPEHWHREFVPQVRFNGFPMALAEGGALLGDDRGHRFLALMDASARGGRYLRWYRKWRWSMGVPAVGGDLIFVGAGGPGATAGLFAIEARSGAIRWAIPPVGPAGDGLSGRTAQISFAIPGVTTPGPVLPGSEGQSSRRNPPGSSSGPRGGFGRTPGVRGPNMTPRRGTPVTAAQSTPLHRHEHSFRENPGVVAVQGRVFAVVRGSIVCLEGPTGKVLWEVPFRLPKRVVCLVASKTHLFACMRLPSVPESSMIQAYRLEDGTLEWEGPVPRTGTLALAHGVLLYCDGKDIYQFAPAERVFRLAASSDRREDYRRPDSPEPEQTEEKPEGQQSCQPAEGAAGTREAPPAAGAQGSKPAPPDPAVADAAVLSLTWGEPLELMVERARARRRAAPGLPLLVSMDWLDPTRSAVRGGQHVWTPAAVERFARACGQLAAVVEPEYFELGADLNVYLARFPEQRPAARALLARAARAVREGSGATRTLVSFNAEVAHRTYGKADYLPFGRLESRDYLTPAELRELTQGLDAIGLTTYPQAGTDRPEKLPNDYLTRLRELFDGRPVLVTRIGVPYQPEAPQPERKQAEWLKRVLRLCYWLDSPMVAYGDVDGARLGLRSGKAREALVEWQSALGWKRVKKLSAEVPGGRIPQRSEPPVNQEEPAP